MRWLLLIAFSALAQPLYAWSWQDLWLTKNQQAQAMMNKGQFSKAKEAFERDDWRATAAYRAGEYEQAARLYQSLKNETAFYNQGNALAHMGQYEQAIKAYNNALAINPNHQDALHNREVVEKLLKQDQNKQEQNKQDQNKQDQNKQEQNKQDQNKQDQNKQDQNKQDQNKQDQNKQDQNKQDQDKQDQDKQDQDKQDQDKQDQDKQDQDKQDKDKQDQDKQDQAKQDKKQEKNKKKNQPDVAQSPAAREKQQAKEQWLRLIPDDPGGLMREKFLRDHLRRQRGWYQ